VGARGVRVVKLRGPDELPPPTGSVSRNETGRHGVAVGVPAGGGERGNQGKWEGVTLNIVRD